MKVDLKGIHTVTANGKRYYYAWRGGPRLIGEPGSPDFIASYHAAHQTLRQPDKKIFQNVIAKFKRSAAMTSLSARTQADYTLHIARIELAFGDLPMAALEDPRITLEFIEWRDRMANSPRQADYAWTVLMRIISWARSAGLTTYRPPDRLERLYHGDRADMIWTDADIAAFLGKASEPLQRALWLALYTGQRQGDLLAVTWSAYDGLSITLRQSKTGVKVMVPVTNKLRSVLETSKRTSLTILTNSKGRPWRPNAFRKAWGAATKAAGISKLTFHDLRGTAVTRLAEAECTPSEIASITGHSMRDVGAMLDRYQKRTGALAFAAIKKLERGEK